MGFFVRHTPVQIDASTHPSAEGQPDISEFWYGNDLLSEGLALKDKLCEPFGV
jgi:hypothetical protein